MESGGCLRGRLLRRLSGAVGEASERLGVADGDVREDLAVELHLGQLQSVHEGAVGHAVLARGGVDARHPEPAEVALAVAPVAVPVLVRLEQRFLGPLVVRVGLAAEALGELEGRPALLLRVDGALDAGHLVFFPSRIFTRWASWPSIGCGSDCRRFRFADFFSRMCDVNAERPRTLPVAVTLKRFFAPEWVFCFGMRSAQ